MATMMTQQRFQSHQSHREIIELKSPEGDLGDVEADFQSLVNEMAADGNKRSHKVVSSSQNLTSTFSSKVSKTTSVSSSSSSSAGNRSFIKSTNQKPNKIAIGHSDSSYVTAMPARVIPEPSQGGDSEIVVEKQMKVRERVKKLEKQLSQDGLESPQPPDVILPRGRSGSIRNIADQFENSGEQANSDPNPRMVTPTLKIDEMSDSRSVREIASNFSGQVDSSQSIKVEGEFKNVKEAATMFQEPFSPITIKPPAPFSDPDAPDPVSPVPVLPPAMKKPKPAEKPEPVLITKPYDHPPLPWKNEISDSTSHQSRISSFNNSSSTPQSVANPTHYNAQVRCEVRSRVNSPLEKERRTRSETRTSSSISSKTMTSSQESMTSSFVPSAPTPLARTAAKPPRAESADSGMPKFSLLRSASTGSVEEQMTIGMNRANSDKDIPKFNVKKVKPISTFGTKVWSPGGERDSDGPSKIETSELPSFKDVPPIWVPGRGGSESPSLGRKEYRKIPYEGKYTMQKRPSQESVYSPNPEDSFAWKNKEAEKLKTSFGASNSSLPRVQSPTVTLLQKKRDNEWPDPDGFIPNQRPDYTKQEEGFCKPGDKLYTIKREYESEDEESGNRKFAVLGPLKYEGVGPTTRDGVPTTLKSGVKSEHQGEWYRRMFDSLHKVKDARYGGYMSEPEGYDSDYGHGSRYATLDRKLNKFEYDVMDSNPKACYYQDNADFDWNTKRYAHQPGRIENYVPGFSTLSEKELRDNPEADVKLEIKTKSDFSAPSVQRFGSGRMQMSHALKESGYESDSTLVFKKREEQRRQQLDPRFSSQVYKQVQQGGEIPLSGLQKPAPPRPKDDFYIVYSDSEFKLKTESDQTEVSSDLESMRSSSRASTLSPTPSRQSQVTFGEKKRTSPSRTSNVIPLPPRRLSSKWHPSLVTKSKKKDIHNPPNPNPRSTSAERVRETRALYSSWHRDKVAKSRERLNCLSPTRTNVISEEKLRKETSEILTKKNFLLDRRAVSESKFMIQDKQKRYNLPLSRSASAERGSTTNVTTPKRSVIRNAASKPISREKVKGKLTENVTVPSKRLYNSLERPPKHSFKPTTTRSATTSPSRSCNDPGKRWSVSSDVKLGHIKHTVSSINKVRATQSFLEKQANEDNTRIHGFNRSSRHINCLAHKSMGEIQSDRIPSKKCEKVPRNKHSSKDSTKGKRLEQSESFETTQSNETGYCSMGDLSPVGDLKISIASSNSKKKSQSSKPSNSFITRERDIVNRRYQIRPHSAPGVSRTKTSAFFNERLYKWQTIARGESSERCSISSSRSNSPLRSLELVKKVSGSFRNIPKEPTPLWIKRSKSLETLSPSPHGDPTRYRKYILELKNAVPKNARIYQLKQLFDSLEKATTLERSISTVELSTSEPRSRGIIDFESWKNLRDQEKKALEYHLLVNKLNEAQKEKDFFYKVNPEKKWVGDCRLYGREHKVHQLKSKFDNPDDGFARSRLRKLEDEKDTYKGLWRGSSVRDLSKNLNSQRCKRGSSLSLTREDTRLRSKGLWTSLSLEQINALREQLTDIYGSMQNIRSWRQRRERSKQKQEELENLDKENKSPNTKFIEAGKAISNQISNMHSNSLTICARDDSSYLNSVQPRMLKIDKGEEQRKRLSKQISMELQEKVAEQKLSHDKFSMHDRSLSVSPEMISRTSPRTCYSLDVSDSSEPTSLTSNVGDQFFLVVRRPERSSSFPRDHNSDCESSDSDASVRTVIHKDVAKKVKFFEKKARRISRSTERYSSRSSFIDPSEVPHYATLPLRHKSKHKNDVDASSYIPHRTMSSSNLNYQYTNTNQLLGSSDTGNTSYSRSYLLHVKTGDVEKLKEKYESTEDIRSRSKSMSDIDNTLARITPSDRTVILGQEVGDVCYTRAKYEVPRQNKKYERWNLPRDEYLPKSKIASTLTTLASRSPSFNEPITLDRISKRDSVEKAILKRVHTGNVEKTVGKFESRDDQSVSLLGQMYTSAPSITELVRLSPLVPSRPPLPPCHPPRKPSRSLSYSPRRLSTGVTSVARPLKTSTPATSPHWIQSNSLSPSRNTNLSAIVPLDVDFNAPKPINFQKSTPYDASAHVPKSRYTPSDLEAATKWTQSLERPNRFKSSYPLNRAKSFSPPPRGPSSLKYNFSRSMSPSQYEPLSLDSGYEYSLNDDRYSRPLSPPFQNYIPSRSSGPRSQPYYAPQNRSSLASTLSYQSSSRIQSPPPYSTRKDSLMLRSSQFREPRSTERRCPKQENYLRFNDHRFNAPVSSTHFNTFPFARNRSSPVNKETSRGSSPYSTLPSRAPSSLSRDGSTKSVTWKEPVIGTLPYSSYPTYYGEPPIYPDSSYKYKNSEVNIHYKTPVRVEHRETLSEEELARRQEEHMKKVYENERRKKYLSELEDIERRRHTDFFSPLQKSTIPLNRYDDEPYGGVRGGRTPEPKQIARALFNFTAQNKRELSFNKGDLITIRRMIDRNWYEGEIRGSVGIFPCNYAEMIPVDQLKTARKPTEGQARARFSFQAQTSMEMSLSKGEMVVLTRRVDENWYEGRIGNRKGIFPVTYVDTLIEPGGDSPSTSSKDPLPRPALPASHLLYNGSSEMSSPMSTLGRSGSQNENKPPFSQLTVNTQQEAIPYRALYNYKPQNEDELELLEGDIVLVMEKCDDGWFVGTSKRTALFGTFPGNYVEKS